ncbi:MAG: hypothetical protein CMC76_07495 [Flavobacteriaceae bacterium]|nr:hypothetical protein [Flavobacteriaceae bacterium]
MVKKMKLILILLVSIQCIGAQESTENDKQIHQFDFWIGEWNVYKFGTDTIIGISSIKSKLNNKVIEENFQSLKYKYQGMSLNTFDSKLNRWEQFYVDNSGLKLHLFGNFEKNKMILSDCGEFNQNCNRITWTDLPDITVRQEWEQSKDKGKTWVKVFDGHYKKRQ